MVCDGNVSESMLLRNTILSLLLCLASGSLAEEGRVVQTASIDIGDLSVLLRDNCLEECKQWAASLR